MNNIFQNVFLDTDIVRRNFDKQTLVYPSTEILLAYEYTNALAQIRLLQLHASEVPGSQGKIHQLKSQIDRSKVEMMLDDAQCKEFKPMQYLDSTALTVESFLKKKKEETDEKKRSDMKKVFPRMFRRRLASLFRELHIYKFYEENYRHISEGSEFLLKSDYHLRKRVPSHFQIDNEVKWSKDEFDLELVSDYFHILERLAEHNSTDRVRISQEEVTSILTSYFSSAEVSAMGVQLKSLNLDIIRYGHTIENLIGEAFVIGRNSEELITVFEDFHIPQYVTVVTGPHFGHPYNRDILTIKIQSLDSLKNVVDEWFKSGSD